MSLTCFFKSETFVCRLPASASWQEDCEFHDEKAETALLRVLLGPSGGLTGCSPKVVT